MSLPAEAASRSTDVTVVLMHGAFADASSWNGVIPSLQQRGLSVIAPPHPLRGLPPIPRTSPPCSAGAQIVELEGSHVIMVSRPDAVTQVIGRALESVATVAAVPTPRQQEAAERAAGRTP